MDKRTKKVESGGGKGDTTKVWKKVSENLSGVLNKETFDRWIRTIIPLDSGKDLLVLGVSDDFTSEWLREYYEELIQEALLREYGKTWKIEYRTGHKPEPHPAANSASNDNSKKTPAPAKCKKPKNAPNCLFRHTFRNFVVGPENLFAHTATMALINSSKGIEANPLFLYGGTGLGKTHLLQAVANRVQAVDGQKVEYLSCEEFLNLYVDSLRLKRQSSFRNRFRKLDFLLIDDIHFLANKSHFQEEFFNTFNTLHNEEKKILLASDKRPSEINGLEARLVSRFDSGLTVEMQPPGVETRMAILKKKQEEQLIKLDDGILFFIANNISSNVRKLEGALIKLLTYSSMTGTEVTVETAEIALKPMLEEEAVPSISISLIQKKVADHFDLRISDLTGSKRPKNIAVPRMLAMYLSRKLTEESLPEIGDHFGGRNHATVIHAVKKIDECRIKDSKMNRTVSMLQRQLQAK